MNMKTRLKSRTIYSDVASDETSVDFNGLQILPARLKRKHLHASTSSQDKVSSSSP